MLTQLLLHGAAIVEADGEQPTSHTVQVEVDPAGVPAHLLVAFGPKHERVTAVARVVQTDLDERRRWERQRESDLAYMETVLEKERAEIRSMSQEFAEWRE